jgi:hypothetical protein
MRSRWFSDEFLSQDDFASLLNRLANHFPSGELAFNLYTTWAV